MAARTGRSVRGGSWALHGAGDLVGTVPFLAMLAGGGRIAVSRTGSGCAPNGLGRREQRELIASVPAGLAAMVWRACGPGRARGPARPGPRYGLAGSSPRCHPLVADGHTWPTPYPVSQGASSDGHRSGVMPGDRGLRLLLEGVVPILGAPAGGVGGVHRDHDQATVIGHAAQAFPETGGGDCGHRAAERPSASPPPHGFATRLPGVGEAEVLDRDTGTAMLRSQAQEFADGGPQTPVALWCGAAEVSGYGERLSGGVAVGVDDAGGEVVGVEVHSQQSRTGLAELFRAGRGGSWGGPGCVQVPAVAYRVVHDVVAHRLMGGHSVQPRTPCSRRPHPTFSRAVSLRIARRSPARSSYRHRFDS
ncbi:hypothetical protein T261_02065 [Streptomyces lydicus]|nr:hypothetical protein T261_02065 [Streptomyces lydicus]